MGGYGVLRIGMKHPEMFSSLYALSPCCLTPTMSMDAKREALAEAIRNPEDVDTADFGTKAMIASAAAWSPNPQNPPLYLDLPIKDGQFQPMVAARWVANSPLALVDQYVGNLRRQRAIAFDAGRQDAAIAGSIKILDQILTRYEITHIYETYEGTHTNRVAERIEARMLPFFSKNLTFQRKR
jgi:S-formylglutathione hydrolase FrmB